MPRVRFKGKRRHCKTSRPGKHSSITISALGEISVQIHDVKNGALALNCESWNPVKNYWLWRYTVELSMCMVGDPQMRHRNPTEWRWYPWGKPTMWENVRHLTKHARSSFLNSLQHRSSSHSGLSCWLGPHSCTLAVEVGVSSRTLEFRNLRKPSPHIHHPNISSHLVILLATEQ